MSRAGNLITTDGQPALRFERRYAHPVERVWRAITDPGEMARWFPAAVIGERAVGAELVFDDETQRQQAIEAGEPTRAEGPVFRGEVLVWEPPHRFCFTWGGEEIRLELAPAGEGTRLVFTHLLRHPSVAARNGAGWHHCLRELDLLLGDGEPAEEVGYDDYVERMGPALGTVEGDAVAWERATHVEPARVRHVVTTGEEREAWGAPAEVGAGERWDVTPFGVGTRYVLHLDGAAGDPTLAAAWHARLLQLDMYLAAGILVPSDPAAWRPRYEALSGDAPAAR